MPCFCDALGVDDLGHVAQPVKDVEDIECQSQSALEQCLCKTCVGHEVTVVQTGIRIAGALKQREIGAEGEASG